MELRVGLMQPNIKSFNTIKNKDLAINFWRLCFIPLSPHDNAQQNFRIFWVGMDSRGNVNDILWSAIKSVILSMSTYLTWLVKPL